MWSQISDHTAQHACTLVPSQRRSWSVWTCVINRCASPRIRGFCMHHKWRKKPGLSWTRAGGWSGAKEINAETGAWADDKFTARVSFRLVLPSAWTFRVLFRLKDTLRLQPMFSINHLLPDSVHLWGKQEKVRNSIYVTNKRNLWSFQGCVGKCLTTGSPEKERGKKETLPDL